VNDEIRELQRRLELATAADGPPDGSLDGSLDESLDGSLDGTPDAEQIASLREGWLALGQLLETAQPAPDEPLQLRPLQLQPLQLRHPTTPPTSRWWKAAAMATVAASLVIGVGLAWSLLRNHSVDPTQPGREMATQNEDAKSQQPTTDLAKNAVEQANSPDMLDVDAAVVDAPDVDALDWDDSLDDQIALVGRQIIQVQGDWYGLDDALSPLREGIDQIEEEFESDTL